jgi:2,4-dienoyl-CoA reductase (NADPH2)
MTLSDIRKLVISDNPTAALFQPERIGQMQLRNRFIQTPIFTQFPSAFGEAGEIL